MSRLRRPAPLVATLSAAAVVVGLVAPAPAAGPIPDPYYPLDGNAGYDVVHYDIRNTYRFDPVNLKGRTTVTLVPDSELTELSLDFMLPVSEVLVDGVAADFTPDDGAGHELTITPVDPLAAGEEVDVRVSYEGDPSAESYAGDADWSSSAKEVVSIGEPHIATWWFPANDHPSDKATFDIRITTGAAKKVISNGRLVGRTVDGADATTHWRMTQPMATYLAFFAAGDYAVRKGFSDGRPWYNAVSTSFGGGPAAVDRQLKLLRRSAAITSWLEDELGEYPFGSTGGIVTDVGPGYALENQTRPIYTSGTAVWLMVHELAHQWFGDSVSVRRWKHIWLNEGFATYMEVRWEETHGGPSANRWLHRVYGDRRGQASWWDVDISDPGPGNLFAWQVYERGAMALAALRNVIGTPKFERLLRRWAAKHQHGDATVPQFIALAENISGKDLDTFFHRWLADDRPPPNRAAFGL